MKRAALVAPVRTAVGRFGGALRDVPAESLAATVVKETVRRSGIDPSRIDDVAMGQSYANSEAPCIGRWAALEAGLPISVAGFQTYGEQFNSMHVNQTMTGVAIYPPDAP